MFIGIYAKKGLTSLLAGALIALSYNFFGDADYFDRLFLFIVGGLFILNIKKAAYPVYYLIGVVFFERILEEPFYFAMQIEQLRYPIYTCVILSLVFFKHDPLVKFFLVPLAILTTLSELRWEWVNYNAPTVHFAWALICINLVTRYLVFNRLPITKKYLNRNSHLDPLDMEIYSLAKYQVWVIGIFCLEYLVRHNTNFKPVLIYHLYTPVMHFVSCYLLLTILTAYFDRKSALKA